MPPLASERLRPWLGSAALHLLFIALIAGFAVKWRTEPPPPQLAIEGSVVRYEDLPSSVKSGKPLREKVPPPVQPAPEPPQPEPKPEPKPAATPPEPTPDPAIEQKRAAQAQARLAVERERAEQQKAAAKQQRETEAARQKALQEKQRQQQLEQEQAAKATKEAKLRAEREAELKRALASEEEGEAVQRSGVVDEYRTLLTQTIERNWIRPPSARPGLECTLDVTQLTGGVVTDVKVGACNGDAAVRESIANAVFKSSPLPAPRDPRAFSRKLVIVFKPTE